jgi:putative membrane protein
MAKVNPYLFFTVLAAAGGCHDTEPASGIRFPQPAASQGDEVTPAEGMLTEEPLNGATLSIEPAPAPVSVAPAPLVASAEPPTAQAPSTAAPNTAPSAASKAAAPAAPTSASASPKPAQPAATPAPTAPDQSIVLTDEQILRVVRVLDNAEISQAELAATKAHSRRVKEFAARLLTQHMKARHRGVQLATTAQITPEDSSMSDAIAAKQAQALADLKAARLSAFDNAYLAALARQQQDVLELLASELMPAATNTELTAELQRVRSAVEAQLAEAKELEQGLGNASAAH